MLSVFYSVCQWDARNSLSPVEIKECTSAELSKSIQYYVSERKKENPLVKVRTADGSIYRLRTCDQYPTSCTGIACPAHRKTMSGHRLCQSTSPILITVNVLLDSQRDSPPGRPTA
jgi:hypothetical protein